MCTFCVHEPGWDFTYELPYSSGFSTLATHFKTIFRLAVIQLDAGPKNKKEVLIFKRLTHTDRSIFEFNLLLNGNALNIFQFQILKARDLKEPASKLFEDAFFGVDKYLEVGEIWLQI